MSDIRLDNGPETAADKKPRGLWNRNFALIWQAHFISQMGTQILVVGQILWIKEASGLASLVGLTSILWTIATILFGPLGGSFADSHDRKRIIVIADFVAGAGSLLIVLFFWLTPGSFGAIFAVVAAVSFANGIVFSFFNPAVQASLPDLVAPEKLQAANSLKQGAFQISQLTGQGLGGIVFRYLGAPVLYLVDAATFFYSGVSTLFIRLPKRPTEKKFAGWREATRHHWKEIKDGIRYIAKEPGLNVVILVFCAINFLVAPMMVLLPFFVDDNLGLGMEWYGFFLASFGIGMLGGYGIAGAIRFPAKIRAQVWAGSLVLLGLVASLGFLLTNRWMIIGVFVLAGIFNGVNGIIFITSFQKRTPEGYRGRLFGVLGAVSAALMPVGTAAAAILNDLWTGHVREILAASFIAMLVVTLIVYPNKKVREYLSWED